MGRPTPEEAKEMEYKKLIKEIWENEFNCTKDDLKVISLANDFVKIKTIERDVSIHRDLIEEHFTGSTKELKIKTLENIKKYLKQLL
jgi:hypothetical protein